MNKPESHLMLKKIGAYALFILIALYVLIPLYALFLATFKDGTDMIQHGLNLEVNLPEMHLKNYAMLFSGEAVRYWVWYRNSMVLTIIQVILTLFISACVAYGFAAYEFPFKIAIAAKDGFIIGRINLENIPYSDAPSILPASWISDGIPVKYCRKKNIVDACAKNGTRTAV